ncbi:adenylate kinase [Phytoactinopolyspora endophytica]|uniref:adenylate kinase n=1 Tax=Phytoactinopolyspora endophytica TaxID=1642495 RepID=UPI00101C7E5D|nr:adenylate kinase [Phytoactinopolyspora endophytica]
MTRLLIMGPPGAGKGTQAQLVADYFGIPAISTGDIFRANASEQTPLGIEAQRYMDAGDYVPDEVTNNMVQDRLSQPDAGNGFLLDGYPRTLAQVEFLDSVLADQNASLEHVIELVVDEEEIVARLLKRAAEEGRTDDSEEVIRNRLHVYQEQTAPLTAVYAERGLLLRVDGLGHVEEVAARVENAITANS